MRALLIIFTICLCASVEAQEVCDNGIDDDGDGLIDLNDPECFCIGNFVTNGTFDAPCPFYPNGWESGYNTNYATGSACFPNNICNVPGPPAPATEFIQLTTSGFAPSGNVYQCLQTPLLAGVTYTLSYDYSICSGPLQIQNPPTSSEIFFYGIINCPADYDFNQVFCPLNYNGPMQIIDQHSFTPVWLTWFNYSVTFTPTVDLEGIAFSGPCWNASANVNLIYTNLTNIVISGDNTQDLLEPILTIGDDCGEWIATADLSNVTVPNPTIQWYLDGVAIDGATDLTYTIAPGTTGVISYALTNSPECGTSDEKEIPTVPEVEVTGTQTNNLCFGDAEGSIQLDVISGTPPYTYQWSNGSTDPNITELVAGPYAVIVTDSLGCSDEVTFNITEPAQAVGGNVVEILPVNPATGFGSATIVGSGGTPGYTYMWDNGEMTSTANALSPGAHTLIITDANGCEIAVMIEVPILPLSVNVFSEPSCPNVCTGQFQVEVSGGIQPYSIVWSDGLMNTNPIGVCPSLYNLTVTDAQQAMIDTIVEVISLPLIFVEPQIIPPTCGVPESGEIFLSSFGEEPFSYLWFDGTTESSIPDLNPGTYVVTITDGNGCSLDTSFIVNPAGDFEIVDEVVPLVCPDDSNAQIIIEVPGEPIENFNFLWSTNDTTDRLSDLGAGAYSVTIEDINGGCSNIRSYEIDQPAFTSFRVDGNIAACLGESMTIQISAVDSTTHLNIEWFDGDTTLTRTFDSAGVFTYSIYDVNGCRQDSSVEIQFLDLPRIDVLVDQIDCVGDTLGAIEILNRVDSLPLSVIWSTGDTSTILQDIGPGTYTANVTNSTGCSIDTVINLRPNALSFEINTTDSVCPDSTGSIFITSTMLDDLIFLWNNGDTTSAIRDLEPGQYVVTVSNNEGCSLTEEVSIGRFREISFSVDQSDESCAGANDGSIRLGFANDEYDVLWTDGPMEENRENLSPGVYNAVVSDGNGCSTNETFTIDRGFELSVQYQVQEPGCTGDTAFVSIELVDPNDYSVEWSDGEVDTNRFFTAEGTYGVSITYLPGGCQLDTLFEFTTNSIPVISADLTNASCGLENGSIELSSDDLNSIEIDWGDGRSGPKVDNLSPGTYTALITSAPGCDTLLSFQVGEIPLTEYAIATKDVLCKGQQSGAIDVIPTEIFQEIRLNGALVDANISDLPAGSYEIILLDSTGCTYVEIVDVLEPEDSLEIRLDTIVQDLTGNNSGLISVSAFGGTSPYSFEWDNGSNGSTISSLGVGSYTVTATDSNGCTRVATFDIFNDPLIVSVFVTDVECKNNCTGSISLDIMGGTPPYDIEVRAADSSLVDLSMLCSGTYDVVIRDVNGQRFEVVDIEILEPTDAFSVSIQSSSDTLFVEMPGIVELSAEIGDPNQISTLEWLQNEQIVCAGDPLSCESAIIEANATDLVILRATSVDGCESLDTIWLVQLEETLPSRIYIPNAIRLSSAVNNVWTVYPYGDVIVHEVAVFDRWGNLIYERDNGEVDWNGTANGEAVVPGVYVYTISYSIGGQGPKVYRSGDITVLP